jgi:hypothetical protein
MADDKAKGSALLIGFGAPMKGGKKPAMDAPEVDVEEGDEGTQALAGSELGKAVKSGDGQRIYDAMEQIIKEVVHHNQDESDEKPSKSMDETDD